MTFLSIDIESKSEEYFGKGPRNVGLDRYSKHPSTEITLVAYAIDYGPVKSWDITDGSPMPADLKAALDDPDVVIHAFNAQFERVMLRECLGIDIPYHRWRCTMARAYQMSFIGGLAEVGECVGLPDDMKKDSRGEALIKLFGSPQRVTKNNAWVWRDSLTNPAEWQEFIEYNIRDVVAEREIWRRLDKYPVGPREWGIYHIDQMMNDKGLPVDRQFLENANAMAERRKAELTAEMIEVTGLANPNSTPQLLAWLVERGYPFNDIGKDTVRKVLVEAKESITAPLWPEVEQALKLRQKVARTSPKKFAAVLYRLPPGEDIVRYAFQYGGASRTLRWASRGGVQLHNMPRTPGWLEDLHTLEYVTNLIREGDYDGLRQFCEWCTKEVDILDALVGCVRSMIRAPEGYEFAVSDLSSIETVGMGLLARCEAILNVFRKGLDAYKDFATRLYNKAYGDVTKGERQTSKPAVLGCGFRLSGGELRDGKKTGLWGYSENMGVNITQAEAEKQVRVYRETYPEVPKLWYELEDAMVHVIETGGKAKVGLLEFSWMKPFMLMRLPSGRHIFYHKPQVHWETRISRKGEPYRKKVITVMGKSEQGNKWVRRPMHGGVACENADQAMCRDILAAGKLAAVDDGFDLRGSVHDELVTLHRVGDNYYTHVRLGECMTAALPYLPGAPLGYDGFDGPLYRK